MRKGTPASLTAITLAVLVVLPNAISMGMDGSIKDYQARILELEISRSNDLQLGSFHNDRVNSFEILEALSALAPRLGMKAEALADKISKSNPKEEELFKQYKSGQLSIAQYLQGMADAARQKRQYYANRVEQVNNEIKSLHNKPPRAVGIKAFLPIVQMLGVILVVWINAPHLRQTGA